MARLAVGAVSIVARVAAAPDLVRRAPKRTSSTRGRKQAAHLAERTVPPVTVEPLVASATDIVVKRPRSTRRQHRRVHVARTALRAQTAVAVVARVARAPHSVVQRPRSTLKRRGCVCGTDLARPAARAVAKQSSVACTADVVRFLPAFARDGGVSMARRASLALRPACKPSSEISASKPASETGAYKTPKQKCTPYQVSGSENVLHPALGKPKDHGREPMPQGRQRIRIG